jgi:hypothetical protein
MKNKKNGDEPRDEFDHIAIPSFVAKPFEKLTSRPAPVPRAQPVDGEYSDRDYSDPDYGDREPGNSGPGNSGPVNSDSVYGGSVYGEPAYGDDENRQPARPAKWYAGSRGKMLAYGAGTLFLLFIQTRG